MAYYFPTTVLPIRATAPQITARVLQANFGDGYNQRVNDGINNINEQWDVQFAALDQTNAAEIIDFLEARGGYQSFLWIPPGESTYKKYICKEWNKSFPGASLTNISAKFMRVFDLD
jgi:phage-related protein